MITSMIGSMVRPMVTSMVNPGSGGAVFSPLTASYTSASFTPVVITNTEIMSFHVKGLTNSSTSEFLFGGSATNASVFYRGSDGRFRLTTDDGTIRQLHSTILNDGGDYLVEMRLDSSGWDLYVDNVFITRAIGSFGDTTLDEIANIMTIGAVYGVTLGGSASWPMQSTSDDVFDGEDMIGSNDLTYNGAPVTITSADTIETTPL